jgi:hypothetical protein
MIDDSRELLFIHISRTAGSSIETALVGKDWWLIDSPTKHISAKQAREHYGESIWTTYNKFSVVRNPWDRVASLWAAKSWHQASKIDLNCSFEFFIKNLKPHPNERYQSLFYFDILNEDIEYILRFENLQEELNSMLDDIGCQPISLPHTEKRSHKHYRNLYTEVEKNLVGEIFEKDITSLGYEF